MPGDYNETVDIVFSAFFSLQIMFNLFAFIRSVRKRVVVILLVNILLTIGLIFRLCMTVFQILKQGHLLDEGGQQEYYQYLYLELPYHMFNVVAFIVLMQWVQLWAVLSEVRDISSGYDQEQAPAEEADESNNFNNSDVIVDGGNSSKLKIQAKDQITLYNNEEGSQIFSDRDQNTVTRSPSPISKRSKLMASRSGRTRKTLRQYKRQFIRFIRQKFFEGRSYTIILYGVVGIVLSCLVIDTIFLSIDAAVREDALNMVFEVFTYFLLIFGLLLLLWYISVYWALYRQFKHLAPELRKNLSRNMNLFFLMMILLLGTRTIYYLFFRFKKFHYEPTENVDNSQLIFIYCEEIFFNFVVFYNTVLKESHSKHLEPQFQKCRTRYSDNKSRKSLILNGHSEADGEMGGGVGDSLLTTQNREEIRQDLSLSKAHMSSLLPSKMNMFHQREIEEMRQQQNARASAGKKHMSSHLMEFEDQEEYRDPNRTITEEDYDEEENNRDSKQERDSHQLYSETSQRDKGDRYAGQGPLYLPRSIKRVTHSGFNMSMATSNNQTSSNNNYGMEYDSSAKYMQRQSPSSQEQTLQRELLLPQDKEYESEAYHKFKSGEGSGFSGSGQNSQQSQQSQHYQQQQTPSLTRQDVFSSSQRRSDQEDVAFATRSRPEVQKSRSILRIQGAQREETSKQKTPSQVQFVRGSSGDQEVGGSASRSSNTVERVDEQQLAEDIQRRQLELQVLEQQLQDDERINFETMEQINQQRRPSSTRPELGANKLTEKAQNNASSSFIRPSE